MKPERKKFILEAQTPWQRAGEGIRRQILGYDNQIMTVKMHFQSGAVGATHSHFHAQTSYIASGRFLFTVSDETVELAAGDGVYIEPNAVHGLQCIEEGVVIDNFSPMREDFV